MSESVIETIKVHFGELEDERKWGQIEHPLINIIFITICAVLCGADDWEAIEEFGKGQKEWLSQYLYMEKGIPSAITFARVFATLDGQAFSQGFINWMAGVSELVEGVVAIDGKQLRHSYDKGIGKKSIYMVSAWAVANGVSLGQRKVDEKSNEITAIPHLLNVLNLEGCIVTIDAMGCQTAIAQQIVDEKADYVLALKGNQGQLHEDVTEIFTYFNKTEFKDVAHDYHKTVNKGHGRIEIRECWAVAPQTWATYFRTLNKWANLSSVVMVRSQRIIGDEKSEETRYFISSLKPQAERLLGAVRAHWSIENGLHWVLDIAFGEDMSRVRHGYASENLAVVRQIVLNLLKQEKTAKVGTKNKRLRCAWDMEYRHKVLSLL